MTALSMWYYLTLPTYLTLPYVPDNKTVHSPSQLTTRILDSRRVVDSSIDGIHYYY